MNVQSIHLVHYRNYTDTSFDLGQHTIFIGPNGSGKTNVLEAIRTLSVTKSFRTAQDRDAIQWDQPYCRIEVATTEGLFEYILTREEFGTKKVIKHNGTIIPFMHVYGLIPTVLFSPETMQLIDGSPQERRRFLDTILGQSDRMYLDALLMYRKVMKERHFVLLRLQQGLGQIDELDFWDHELVRYGSYMSEQRIKFIMEINSLLETIYPHFAGGTEETFCLRYKPSINVEDYAKRLQSTRQYDTRTGTTSVGPHRDDLQFLLRHRDVTLFASRGELRRSVIATKMAEAQFLKAAKGTQPLLLLDDVFSELDAERRVQFLAAIRDERTVITTTDLSFLGDHNLPNATIHMLGGA